MEKIKAFLLKYKKTIINFSIMIGAVILISVITLAILMATGILYTNENGDLSFHVEMFDNFKSSWYGWIVFILLQTVLSVLLCVVPGASMAFIILSQSLYNIPWQAFLLSFTSVMISSFGMYLVGRFGGYKMCVKLLGEEDCEKSLGLLRNKGTVFFPLMMMFPVFPDDALVMIAGTIKMSPAWFVPSIVIGRGIGIATIIFGLAIIPFDTFTLIHWIVFVILALAAVLAIFAAANKLNKYLESRNHTEEKAENAPETPDAPLLDTEALKTPEAPKEPSADTAEPEKSVAVAEPEAPETPEKPVSVAEPEADAIPNTPETEDN